MKLSKNEITFLADSFPEASTISLFRTVQTVLKGDEAETLAVKGVLQDGAITETAQPILQILANANQASRLIARDGLTVLELYTYRVGDAIALAESKGDGIEVSMPEDFSRIGYDVSQYIGTSARKTTGIEILLPEAEAMALLTLIDVYRHWTLRSYLGDEVADAVTLEQIRGQGEATGDSSLVDMFRINYGWQAPNMDVLPLALDALVRKGLVTNEGGYRLSAECALFAKSFLVPTTSLLVESFSINSDGELVVGGGLGLIAGVCDQAFFLVDEEEMELKAMAGLEMLQMIEGFLACPEL